MPDLAEMAIFGHIYGQKWPNVWPNKIAGMAMAMVAMPDFTSMSVSQFSITVTLQCNGMSMVHIILY